MMTSARTVVVALSAYNEGQNLGAVVEGALAHGGVIVVDDGSTDDTAEKARAAGARVIRHPMNLGQGLAVLTGFKAALDEGYDVIVEMDADGQHDPAEIPVLLERMEESGADFVVGSRILGSNHEAAPWVRRYFLPKLTNVLNALTGYQLTDSMCGFRAFRSESLRRILPVLDAMIEPQYLSAEMFIRFSRAGLIVAEAPIHLHDRQDGVSTKGLFRYGWGVTRAILKSILERGG